MSNEANPPSVADELEKLTALWQAGDISQREFEEAKRQVLDLGAGLGARTVLGRPSGGAPLPGAASPPAVAPPPTADRPAPEPPVLLSPPSGDVKLGNLHGRDDPPPVPGVKPGPEPLSPIALKPGMGELASPVKPDSKPAPEPPVELAQPRRAPDAPEVEPTVAPRDGGALPAPSAPVHLVHQPESGGLNVPWRLLIGLAVLGVISAVFAWQILPWLRSNQSCKRKSCSRSSRVRPLSCRSYCNRMVHDCGRYLMQLGLSHSRGRQVRVSRRDFNKDRSRFYGVCMQHCRKDARSPARRRALRRCIRVVGCPGFARCVEHAVVFK